MALALSLALHAGGLASLAHLGVRHVPSTDSQLSLLQGFELPSPPPQEPEPSPPLPPPPPPPPEEPLRLGVEDATEERPVWKGSATPTEHLAPQSEVDQAALAINPASAPPSAGEQPIPDGSTPDTAEPEPEPAQTQPAQPEPAQPEPPQELEQQSEPAQPVPEQPRTPEQEAPEQEPEPETPEQEPPQPDVPEPELPSPLVQPAPQPPAPQPYQPLPIQLLPPQPLPPQPLAPEAREPLPPPTPSPAPAAPDAPPGKKAEEESAAAAIAGSLVYKPGEPLAGKGLRIYTVQPRFGYATLATATPRNTVVLITFGRDGRVLRAVFKDRGTGFDEVDKPLIDAIYRWTARGEALKKLPADQPRAGITFEVKFLMERL